MWPYSIKNVREMKRFFDKHKEELSSLDCLIDNSYKWDKKEIHNFIWNTNEDMWYYRVNEDNMDKMKSLKASNENCDTIFLYIQSYCFEKGKEKELLNTQLLKENNDYMKRRWLYSLILLCISGICFPYILQHSGMGIVRVLLMVPIFAITLLSFATALELLSYNIVEFKLFIKSFSNPLIRCMIKLWERKDSMFMSWMENA